jgi:hypothetical protein
MGYNRIHGTSGHVWGERFFSKIIPSLREFLRVFEYIDNNPIEACLVANKDHWKYCGGYFRRIGQDGFLSRLSRFVLSIFPNHVRIPA